jgi:hypothetical protein
LVEKIRQRMGRINRIGTDKFVKSVTVKNMSTDEDPD